jgi:hypothetical protein
MTGEGLSRPFPRPLPGSRINGMTEGNQRCCQSVKGQIAPSEGFTLKAASCSNRKLYQERGSVYAAVGKFMTHGASKFQTVQHLSTNGVQQVQ